MSDVANLLSNRIIALLTASGPASSKQIFELLKEGFSYPTVKRALSALAARGVINKEGASRATRYSINDLYLLTAEVDADEYFTHEIDERNIRAEFNFDLIAEQLPKLQLFTVEQWAQIRELHEDFQRRTRKSTAAEFRREFQRLAIDLSWKSSQIEGNTYSLLETERLLLEKETAAGKTYDEAVMLLNHKAALDFLLDHPTYVQPLTVSAIEDIHSMLIKDLNVSRNIRNRRVGISGTNYRPLDNEFQIREALQGMCTLVNSRTHPVEKALLTLLLISYIQPFADGNKRTARIMSNAVLMSAHYCPLSFRTVSPLDYKKAMLIFYEQNNLTAFRKIFLEQFEFAVYTYF